MNSGSFFDQGELSLSERSTFEQMRQVAEGPLPGRNLTSAVGPGCVRTLFSIGGRDAPASVSWLVWAANKPRWR
jgi:hypothetical protein